MQAIKCLTTVDDNHQVTLPPEIAPGSHVEIIVLLRDFTTPDETSDLVAASAGSLGFWDNATDNEVWNDA